jgi:hypothetical protein
MSHPEEQAPASELDPAGQESVRELVRDALSTPSVPPDLTQGVQRRIRARSRGKFYADGWSTSKHPPVNTYLVTSVMMLALLCAIYALLHPLSGSPLEVAPPAPVNVVPGGGSAAPASAE